MPYKLQSHADRQRAKRRHLTDRARGTAHQRGYGATWRRLRKMVLARQPVCATFDCHQPSKDVHHLIPKPKGDDSITNLQGLCHECHARITAGEGGGFGNRRGAASEAVRRLSDGSTPLDYDRVRKDLGLKG